RVPDRAGQGDVGRVHQRGGEPEQQPPQEQGEDAGPEQSGEGCEEEPAEKSRHRRIEGQNGSRPPRLPIPPPPARPAPVAQSGPTGGGWSARGNLRPGRAQPSIGKTRRSRWIIFCGHSTGRLQLVRGSSRRQTLTCGSWGFAAGGASRRSEEAA